MHKGIFTRSLTRALVLAAAVLGPAAPASAVVGGQPAKPGMFPYVANIAIGGSFGCSGVLIAPDWVLTAGHCGSITGAGSEGLVGTPLSFPPSAYGVTLGTVNADGTGGETHSVTQVIVDTSYYFYNGDGNDVTLLQLDSPSKIKPELIAAVGERPIWEPGVLATIAGFGTTAESSSTPPATMQYAKVPITTDTYCAGAYPNGLSAAASDGAFDANTMLCAGYPQGGTDTCQGDSGGPLLAPLAGGELRLVGATSFGQGCAEAGHPGVYARVAQGPIRSFIASVVPQAFAPEPKAAVKPVVKPKAKAKAKPKAKKRKAKAKPKRKSRRR